MSYIDKNQPWFYMYSPSRSPLPPNWRFWTVVLEKTLESLLDSKETKSVNPKGNQPWTFIGRTDAEAEAPTLWPADAKHQLIGKDPDPGKDWGQEEKRATEDEMVRWYHWLNGHEFEQTLGDNEGQKLGVLQFMGLQRIGHALVSEQQHCILNQKSYFATAKIIVCFFSFNVVKLIYRFSDIKTFLHLGVKYYLITDCFLNALLDSTNYFSFKMFINMLQNKMGHLSLENLGGEIFCYHFWVLMVIILHLSVANFEVYIFQKSINFIYVLNFHTFIVKMSLVFIYIFYYEWYLFPSFLDWHYQRYIYLTDLFKTFNFVKFQPSLSLSPLTLLNFFFLSHTGVD